MYRRDWDRPWSRLARWSQQLAIPVAAILLMACYAQALFGLIPMGRQDPFARLLGAGFDDVSRQVEQERTVAGAAAIVTTDYATTAWFAFYTRLPVIQINDDERWLAAPRATPELLGRTMLYIVEQGRDRHALVATHFGTLKPLPPIVRERRNVALGRYLIYRASRYSGPPVGRVLERKA